MNDLLLLGVLALVAGLAVAAKWLRLPYPIVFLSGGVVLALIPGVPTVALDPELVFFVFLPPLVFGDGYVTDFRQFKRYLEPIALLSIGLVIATSITVAYVAHALIGLPLAVGFVLGAILSPTDTVATDAIAEETPMPRRIVTILSGESLVNDATGLVLYKFAVGAVLAGTFSLGGAIAQFLYVAIVGIAIGVLGSWLLQRLVKTLNERGLTDDAITVTITLVTPFLLYLAADRVGASGVLAAAAGGILSSRTGGAFETAESRILGRAVWNTLFFVFNGTLFILLGLQLRGVFEALQVERSSTLAIDGAVISLTVILARLVWVPAVAYGRRIFRRRIIDAREGPPMLSSVVVLSWAGMRGIVSLAAALALPNMMPGGGSAFPDRALILFITFVVIVATLVGQGLTLPWLLRRFGAADPASTIEASLALARVRTADAAIARLRELEPSFVSQLHWEVAGRLLGHYEDQRGHYQMHLDGDADDDEAEHVLTRRLYLEAFTAERRVLRELRSQGQITDDVFRWVQYDIDLAESRLR